MVFRRWFEFFMFNTILASFLRITCLRKLHPPPEPRCETPKERVKGDNGIVSNVVSNCTPVSATEGVSSGPPVPSNTIAALSAQCKYLIFYQDYCSHKIGKHYSINVFVHLCCNFLQYFLAFDVRYLCTIVFVFARGIAMTTE